MCIEDLWIARHTIVTRLGTTSPIAVPANPNRLGFLIVSGSNCAMVSASGLVWFAVQGPIIATAWNTTDTNEVPPTDNTGTISISSANRPYLPITLPVGDYGSIILGQSTFTYSDVQTYLFEMTPDAALAEMLNQLEYNKGWPLYKLPPSLKAPNG